VSSATGRPRTALLIGLRMVLLILRFRRRVPRSRARPSALGLDAANGDRTHERLSL
jgi:hypothetical protein